MLNLPNSDHGQDQGEQQAMVKKLNCWGADLTDVSVVRRLQGVEVLSLRSVLKRDFDSNLTCQKV